MLSKFTIEYGLISHHVEKRSVHRSDDPVETEEFLMHLLALGARIHAIKHEGVDLPRAQFDQMLKIASGRLASERLGRALGIDAAEVNHRFGFPA